MTTLQIIRIWNIISQLKPTKSIEGKSYILALKKAIRNTYNEYLDFERDAIETLREAGQENDQQALADLLAPEQNKSVDITLPELKDEVLFELMEANPDVPNGAYDILIFPN